MKHHLLNPDPAAGGDQFGLGPAGQLPCSHCAATTDARCRRLPAADGQAGGAGERSGADRPRPAARDVRDFPLCAAA